MQTTVKQSFANITDAGKPKRIANNTFRYTRADGTQVTRLHLTDIIEALPDGRHRVTTGGWMTVTTKDRLNAYTPYRFYSNGKGGWTVSSGADTAPFYDGMILPDAFKGKALEKAEKAAAKDAELKAKITKFVLKTLPTGKPMPVPHNGDCWACLMFDKEEPVTADTPMGPARAKPARERDASHLLQHINEGYMHGSLIVNAMRDAGFKDEGISYLAFSSSPSYDRVRRIVRRYLQKRLGLTF